jgi:hypothetical protein
MLDPMNEVTVVHLVSADTQSALSEELTSSDFTAYIEIQLESDPAKTCAKITQSIRTAHLVIIATGKACEQLPAIALAQKAGNRKILSYQLISPALPPFTESWPNAPITAYFPPGSTIPRDVSLRGIEVARFPGEPAFAELIDNCLP